MGRISLSAPERHRISISAPAQNKHQNPYQLCTKLLPIPHSKIRLVGYVHPGLSNTVALTICQWLCLCKGKAKANLLQTDSGSFESLGRRPECSVHSKDELLSACCVVQVRCAKSNLGVRNHSSSRVVSSGCKAKSCELCLSNREKSSKISELRQAMELAQPHRSFAVTMLSCFHPPGNYTLPEADSEFTPERWCLEDDRYILVSVSFLGARPSFRGELLDLGKRSHIPPM